MVKFEEQISPKLYKAVFLDRDGVIVELLPGEFPDWYITSWEQVKFIPGADKALSILSQAGYRNIVVSNQAGVAAPEVDCTEDDVTEIFDKMCQRLGTIHSYKFCPHERGAGCACRKPAPGMILHQAVGHDISPARSWMIGDSPTDMVAGVLAGIIPGRCLMVGAKAALAPNQAYIVQFPTGSVRIQPQVFPSLIEAVWHITTTDEKQGVLPNMELEAAK